MTCVICACSCTPQGRADSGAARGDTDRKSRTAKTHRDRRSYHRHPRLGQTVASGWSGRPPPPQQIAKPRGGRLSARPPPLPLCAFPPLVSPAPARKTRAPTWPRVTKHARPANTSQPRRPQGRMNGCATMFPERRVLAGVVRTSHGTFSSSLCSLLTQAARCGTRAARHGPRRKEAREGGKGGRRAGCKRSTAMSPHGKRRDTQGATYPREV